MKFKVIKKGVLLIVLAVTMLLSYYTVFEHHTINFTMLLSQEQTDSQVERKFNIFLENHSVFRKLNLTRVNYPKKIVNILVIVSSAPKRSDRRDSIRKTWWKDCVPTNKVCTLKTIIIKVLIPGSKGVT